MQLSLISFVSLQINLNFQITTISETKCSLFIKEKVNFKRREKTHQTNASP